MMKKNKKHSELIYEYNRIKRLYNHYLVKESVTKSNLTWSFDDTIYGHYPISECKAVVGECREMLNFYSSKLKELKRKIKECQRSIQNEQNAGIKL